MAKNKIKNNQKPSGAVANNILIDHIDSHLYMNNNLVVDFSFEGAFISCKMSDFNNYLKDSNEFISKIREMMVDIQKLSQNSLNCLFLGGSFRHCHKTKDEAKALVIIKEIFNQLGRDEKYYEQLIDGEEIFQMGLQSEIRIFGTIKGNIFKAYFIDYHHDFEYNQQYNIRNKKMYKFCPIKTELN